MFYEWINGERRQPITSGERTKCRLCGGELTGVLSAEKRAHWRHVSRKDCDTWSENEGPWHLAWKERFPMEAREVPMVDEASGERHRADVFLAGKGGRGVTIELQHSPMPEPMARVREAFYGARGPMVWVVHLHDESAFHATSFRLGLGGRRDHVDHEGRTFIGGRWASRSSAFISKWKRSGAHVVFDIAGVLFYLATHHPRRPFVTLQAKDEFAVWPMTHEQFLAGLQRMANEA